MTYLQQKRFAGNLLVRLLVCVHGRAGTFWDFYFELEVWALHNAIQGPRRPSRRVACSKGNLAARRVDRDGDA